MNPEEILIMIEEDGEPFERDSFASVPMGDLIEGGYQFSFTDENAFNPTQEQELENLRKGVYDSSLFELHSAVHQGMDMEFDEFDPPLDTRSSYWAGPWEQETQEETELQFPIPELTINLETLNRALLLNDQISQAEPWSIINGYFGTTKTVAGKRLKVGPRIWSYPEPLRRFLQKAVELRCGHLPIELKRETEKKLASAEDEFEAATIKEVTQEKINRLQRVLLRDDPPKRSFEPVTKDQYAQADERFTHQEMLALDHIEEEARRTAAENEDWFPQMWTPENEIRRRIDDKETTPEQRTALTARMKNAKDGLVKSTSGGEATYHWRNKNEREALFQRGMGWIKRQSDPKALRKALRTISQKTQASRTACSQKKNWSEVYLTKVQVDTLRTAIKEKL